MTPGEPESRPVGEKSDRAFRTISEVSAELGVPQHVLRFWETRFAQVRPMKRNGGRRLYRPDHLALLRGIRALLYDDGMTIKGVQKVLREQGIGAVVARGEGRAPLSLPTDTPERLAALRARISGDPVPGTPHAPPAAGAEGGASGPAADPADASTDSGPEVQAARDEAALRTAIGRLERLLARLEDG